MRDSLIFYVNGKRQQVRGLSAFRPLSDYLRIELGLTGTKVVCAEGDCGSCTVLLGRFQSGKWSYDEVDCCIQYLFHVNGAHVITVEALREGGMLHPIQQAMVDHFGSQCGYCTPGFLMALVPFVEPPHRAFVGFDVRSPTSLRWTIHKAQLHRFGDAQIFVVSRRVKCTKCFDNRRCHATIDEEQSAFRTARR